MPRILKFFSRISIRLLTFNILLVILPLSAFLFLDTYERQLLAAQEESMVQQGRLLSIALSEAGPLGAERAEALLRRLQGRTLSRLRVVDRDGTLVADSSVLFGTGEVSSGHGEDVGGSNPEPADVDSAAAVRMEESEEAADATGEVSRDWLYVLFTDAIKFFRDLTGAPRPELEYADYYTKDKPLMGPEIKAALEGRYGATTRYSIGEQRRSIIMYSAIPVTSGTKVVGAVLVSQSTYRILVDLYEVRMATLRIFLFCFILAVVLSLFLSSTIGRPLRKLRNEAEAVLDTRGRLMRPFRHTTRPDEIGDLGRALTRLTERLAAHIRFIEAFAADLSHEFKNPLASIRSAAEIALDASSQAERRKFLSMVSQDVARMERLLSGAREITQLDVSMATEPLAEVDLGRLLEHIASGARLREEAVVIEYRPPEKEVIVSGREERLAQVFENLLDNAVSFSPRGETVRIALAAVDHQAVVTVSDRGPGIPEAHQEKIFERFFTFRPAAGRTSVHTGLGLSIVKVIVEGYNGRVTVLNGEEAGAIFEVRLPQKMKL
ncbi:MAG TPA: HAMP domain-containing protein [Spirochaetia bacterium]|nr:HAMP domain-containing protein [Spirochaetia bacterium]